MARGLSLGAIDLATGERVRLRFDEAGAHVDQQAWVESCTRAYSEGTLVDFGFIAKDRRFEAVSLIGRSAPPLPVTPPVADWLESGKPSSTRILRLTSLPDAREIRLRGFVPLELSLLSDASPVEVAPLIKGRSVVLLDSSCVPSRLALAVLRLRRAHVREACALARRAGSGRSVVENAAERRAVYEPRPPAIGSARVGGLFVDGERLLAAGRHAAAERSLRAAMAAFDRRGDVLRAGDAAVVLGQLLMSRGRAADASGVFEGAHDRFQRARAAIPALIATVRLGMAQVDLGLLCEAERSCRAAYAAASSVNNAEATALAGGGLVRALSWQDRYSDARAVLESIAPTDDPEARARYWCLAARLHMVGNNLADARRALARARPASHVCAPAIESLVRRWEAVVQARLGDVEALGIHVKAGLAAARAAHLPLRALKLRLTLIEGLIDAERWGPARSASARLRGISRSSVPPLLKRRVDAVLARANGAQGCDARPSSISVREAVTSFHAGRAAHVVEELDGLRDLLSQSHQSEDETEALTRAAASIRTHTHAIGVGMFGRVKGEERLLGSAGATSSTIARRALDTGMAIGPESSGGWIEGAVPMRYLGRVIGALALRWTSEGPEDGDRAMAFSSAAAAGCAPLIYVLLERQGEPIRDHAPFGLVGVSAAIEEVRKAIARAANAPFTVLVDGESGSGKEVVARAIHRAGSRRERRFCAFNCAAMPDDLIDVELFGHAKGAFTGAAGERVGLFESADGGTVFLDEVAELSARAQAKILRVIQEGEVRRIGENVSRSFDARLVAATNRSLRGEVDAGRFRQDLLYRLDVIRISVPPLRERVEDIPLLAASFWQQSAERMGSKAVLGRSAVSALARYDWPGNVRELQNVLTALVVAVPSRGVVGASQMPAAIARVAHADSHESLGTARLKFEQRFVRAALARSAGHRGQTAAALGLSRQGLTKLMQRLHLDD